ncbi:hypothetical protein [Alteribacillus bidgolensis]|uniref:hypothetical protein n=1 Tax=Alteribacillus bidgolensis TaxID=930129 RepID=UPI00111409CC|nr:hypothetical protein [Alteribacillus bidgolensis]
MPFWRSFITVNTAVILALLIKITMKIELCLMHWGYFHPFGLFFFIVLAALFIANITIWTRRDRMCYQKSDIAITTLDNRLAKSENTIDEYNDIKEAIKGYAQECEISITKGNHLC